MSTFPSSSMIAYKLALRVKTCCLFKFVILAGKNYPPSNWETYDAGGMRSSDCDTSTGGEFLHILTFMSASYGTWIGLQIETSSTPPLCYCVHRSLKYLQFFTQSGMIEIFGIVILKLVCFSGLSYYLFMVFHVRWKPKSIDRGSIFL